jgi:hypothetical protein
MRIVGKMIPAVESAITESSIGDMGSVPAVKAAIQGKTDAVSCIAVIDTGAHISLLDESLFRMLGNEVREARHAAVSFASAGGSLQRGSVYRLQIKLYGESSRQRLVLKNVPVVVMRLGRQLLMLGRKGALERLILEIDFPGGKVAVIHRRTGPEKYAALTREFPGAIALMSGEEFLQGIRMLSLMALS